MLINWFSARFCLIYLSDVVINEIPLLLSWEIGGQTSGGFCSAVASHAGRISRTSITGEAVLFRFYPARVESELCQRIVGYSL